MNKDELIPVDKNITHYKQLKDSPYIGHWDLPVDGTTVKVIIDQVFMKEKVFNPASNKEEEKSTVSFKGRKKRLILNATNMKSISSWHSTNPNAWIGKEIDLFRTTTKVKGQIEECVRIKPNTKSRSNIATAAAE